LREYHQSQAYNPQHLLRQLSCSYSQILTTFVDNIFSCFDQFLVSDMDKVDMAELDKVHGILDKTKLLPEATA
jgi:hypothetical protein